MDTGWNGLGASLDIDVELYIVILVRQLPFSPNSSVSYNY